jgi:hypothetical protein
MDVHVNVLDLGSRLSEPRPRNWPRLAIQQARSTAPAVSVLGPFGAITVN